MLTTEASIFISQTLEIAKEKSGSSVEGKGQNEILVLKQVLLGAKKRLDQKK